jgi:hypothetical protein
MNHFEDSAWADYVRNVADRTETDAIAGHLAAGCDSCEHKAQTFSDLARLAIEDASLAPPAHVIRAARAIFALRRPERVGILPRLAARLVFDSFLDPMPAGVRGGQPMTRQVLYEAGPYAVDLRLDHARGSRRVWLTGQIASSETAHPIDNVSIRLATPSGRIAGQAHANAAGEFQLEYEPQSQLQLCIDVRPDQKIELPLLSQPDESAENGQR